MRSNMANVQIQGSVGAAQSEILTSEALAFIAKLQDKFNARRLELLRLRQERQKRLDSGVPPSFRDETRAIREGEWKVAPAPADLNDRRVEITGPVDRKMMINALNSGAKVFMADFEDSLSPTWANVIEGQVCCREAVRRTLSLTAADGRQYKLNDRLATLVIRPRGWHLTEDHLLVNGAPVSASLVDFGLYFFHNAKELIARGSGPYFYLPKMESHLEARLWNDVFIFAQAELGIAHGTVRATCLIETILAAFEMEEILYELKDHSAGLNAGRWDYIFSAIKKFSSRSDQVLPDRAQITMTVPFMRAYTELLVRTCHKRGAHALGGMAAFIPSRKDPVVNETALKKVREDKERECRDGFDGTWVAHPDLVPVAQAIFDGTLGPKPNQKNRLREDVNVTALELADLTIPGATITEDGMRMNVNVALQYLDSWLRGIGAAAIHNLMEDAATAEISRAELWQWIRHGARLTDGRPVTAELYTRIRDEELQRLGTMPQSRLADAARLLDEFVLGKEFVEFITIPAYRILEHKGESDMDIRRLEAEELKTRWTTDPRWKGSRRDHTAEDVLRLRPSITPEHTLAEAGADRLWKLLNNDPFVAALGALTGAQAVQYVKAGLKALYLSGWQVAADANLSGNTYPDQSLYPSNSVPTVVRRLNSALMRADQIQGAENKRDTYWYAPIIADAEAGFGGPLHSFELMKSMIEAGAAGVHFEDQLAAEKKCGHLGGKVLIPTSSFINTLKAARLAADVMDVPSVIIARTDALGATLLTSDIDPRDRAFLTGTRTPEGYFCVKPGLETAIARSLAYAPYADLLWFETSKPDLAEARRFAEAIHAQHPGKLLAYNCSPSFNWKKHLDDATIAKFQDELGAMGYKFQFITLAGWHLINYHSFDLARGYKEVGMSAYVELQEAEFAAEKNGYTATKHQREVGTGYFDEILMAVTAGQASTSAMSHSTETEQFL